MYFSPMGPYAIWSLKSEAMRSGAIALCHRSLKCTCLFVVTLAVCVLAEQQVVVLLEASPENAVMNATVSGTMKEFAARYAVANVTKVFYDMAGTVNDMTLKQFKSQYAATNLSQLYYDMKGSKNGTVPVHLSLEEFKTRYASADVTKQKIYCTVDSVNSTNVGSVNGSFPFTGSCDW